MSIADALFGDPGLKIHFGISWDPKPPDFTDSPKPKELMSSYTHLQLG